MAIDARAVAVDDAPAVRLDTVSATDDRTGQSIIFWNAGADTVYVGGSGVTAAQGCPVPANSWSPAFDVGDSEGVYVICDTGDTATLRVLEQGV